MTKDNTKLLHLTKLAGSKRFHLEEIHSKLVPAIPQQVNVCNSKVGIQKEDNNQFNAKLYFPHIFDTNSFK